MNEFNSKKVITGLVLIIFAAGLLIDKMGIFPDFPLFKIATAVLLVYVMIINGIGRHGFLAITFPMAILACLFSKELGIAMVSPAIIILVAILIGVGLSLIFGKSPIVNVVTNHHGGNWNHSGHSSTIEYSSEDGTFSVDNNLGERTEYVTVKNLRRGDIDNALGSLTVYLNGSTLDPNGAFINIDNGLGSLKVFIPKEFRISMKCDNGLGTINTHGNYSCDESSPLLSLDIDNGLGTTDIYFE